MNRRHAYWTLAEDMALLAYVPHASNGQSETLRDVAARLSRTYYAARHRRKELLAGRIKPGERYRCGYCGGPLPEGRKHGYCDTCSRASYRASQRRAYRQQRERALEYADRLGQPWNPEDEQRLMTAELPMVDLARELGRTPAACVTHRTLLRRRRDLVAAGG